MITPPPPPDLCDRDVVFIDLETTGLDPYAHEILEIGALRLNYLLQFEVDRYSALVAPSHLETASPEALKANRFNAEEWRSAVPLDVALRHLARLITPDAIVVGHNTHFDWGFIREAHRRVAYPMIQTKYLIDTASIGWPLVIEGEIEKPSLEALCALHGISNQGAHRAMRDVERTAQLYARLVNLPAPLGGSLARAL